MGDTCQAPPEGIPEAEDWGTLYDAQPTRAADPGYYHADAVPTSSDGRARGGGSRARDPRRLWDPQGEIDRRADQLVGDQGQPGKFMIAVALHRLSWSWFLMGYGTPELLAMSRQWLAPVTSVHPATARCTPEVCRPYPSNRTISFCNQTVQDKAYRVHCSLAGEKARSRDDFVRVFFEAMPFYDAPFKQFIESSPVCKASFIDSLCLDAFPHCHCDDIKVCEVSCWSMNLCLRTQEREEIDCAQACPVSSCKALDKSCKVAVTSHSIFNGSVSTLVFVVVTMSLASHLRLRI